MADQFVVVTHGSNATTARPAAPVVYWVGTVQPLNAQPQDLWYDTDNGA